MYNDHGKANIDIRIESKRSNSTICIYKYNDGNLIYNYMYGYPQEVKYWSCSDGRTFLTEKQAMEHEEFLEKNVNASNASYLMANDLENVPFDVRFGLNS